ncbi:para-nitrobenzyl esterase-like [Chrysoperla carnea]|uniref:para-nitrobenzyl esterase-like n=1 Tax=Chrysoperla carnea TaxID=189513 RepID=UPI001D082211|nr:para-nitrobenzyl esterase-like [Chrysoperla carnea]
MSTLFYCSIFSVLWMVTRIECYDNFIEENVTLTIEQGTLFGKKSLDYWNGTFYSFEGIPYAKPPIGELRFKSPKLAAKWSGIYDATKLRPVCPQIVFSSIVGMEQNEDCLFVNVHSKMSIELKPVMVWFFEGRLQQGSIFESRYGPELLLSEDIVLVKVSFRLNIFGFLKDDPMYGVHGNMGFKDQVLALKWIQRNIHYFGGDRDLVTIFGEGAGGTSVSLLCLSPLTKGLFHRAIIQSGSPESVWLDTPKKYSHITIPKMLHQNINCSNAVKCINESTTESVISDVKQLDQMKSIDKIFNITHIPSSVLTIEQNCPNSFLSEEPEKILKSGNFTKVPIIMGFTSDEGACSQENYFVPRNFTDSRLLIPKDINIGIESEAAFDLGNKIKEVYYGNQTPSNQLIDPFIEYLTDLKYLTKIYKYAKLFSESTPVYFYEFNYYTKLNQYSSPKYISHGFDLPYLFFNKCVMPENMDNSSEEYIAIHRMLKLWTTFAKTGNPNPVNDPLLNVKWLPIESNKFNYLKISQNLEMKQNPAENRMKFWEQIYKQYGIRNRYIRSIRRVNRRAICINPWERSYEQ